MKSYLRTGLRVFQDAKVERNCGLVERALVSESRSMGSCPGSATNLLFDPGQVTSPPGSLIFLSVIEN